MKAKKEICFKSASWQGQVTAGNVALRNNAQPTADGCHQDMSLCNTVGIWGFRKTTREKKKLSAKGESS